MLSLEQQVYEVDEGMAVQVCVVAVGDLVARDVEFTIKIYPQQWTPAEGM